MRQDAEGFLLQFGRDLSVAETACIGFPIQDWSEGKKFLEERSPLTHVSKIRRPLLIGQGANDPRVKQSESDQIVKVMQAHKIPVTYVLFADEGHGFARPPNRLAFYAVSEAFLAGHLGGRYEQIGPEPARPVLRPATEVPANFAR